MGCTITNKSDQSPEEQLIDSVEQTWSFTQINSQLLIDSISILHTGPLLTYKQLKDSLKCLTVYSSATRSFLKHFTMKAPMPIKKIFCLYILKGKSKFQQKLRLLFKVYAESELRIILKSEVELLISHILQITLTSIPNYCAALYPDNEVFLNYSSKVGLFANSLLRYFTGKLMMNNLEIVYSDMSKSFGVDEELALLLKCRKLREFCVSVFAKQYKITLDLSPRRNKGSLMGKEQEIKHSEEHTVNLNIT